LNSSVNFLLLIAIVTSLQPTSYVGNLSVHFLWLGSNWVGACENSLYVC
jgi:hypothetical protein